MFRPETGKYLVEIAQTLLRGPSPLTESEREMIAAYVSSRNNCGFCMNSHAAAARCLLGDEESLMDDLLNDPDTATVSNKMKALLNIAAKVQVSGREVSQEDIDNAREAGAGDMDIHDTVLIAASFSMFNRYVDGLNSLTPESKDDYREMGIRMVEKGYTLPQQQK